MAGTLACPLHPSFKQSLKSLSCGLGAVALQEAGLGGIEAHVNIISHPTLPSVEPGEFSTRHRCFAQALIFQMTSQTFFFPGSFILQKPA